eukprot:6528081-Pyramimonas_sp.AAC.1
MLTWNEKHTKHCHLGKSGLTIEKHTSQLWEYDPEEFAEAPEFDVRILRHRYLRTRHIHDETIRFLAANASV